MIEALNQRIKGEQLSLRPLSRSRPLSLYQIKRLQSPALYAQQKKHGSQSAHVSPNSSQFALSGAQSFVSAQLLQGEPYLAERITVSPVSPKGSSSRPLTPPKESSSANHYKKLIEMQKKREQVAFFEQLSKKQLEKEHLMLNQRHKEYRQKLLLKGILTNNNTMIKISRKMKNQVSVLKRSHHRTYTDALEHLAQSFDQQHLNDMISYLVNQSQTQSFAYPLLGNIK